jgi:hypothetical protein
MKNHMRQLFVALGIAYTAWGCSYQIDRYSTASPNSAPTSAPDPGPSDSWPLAPGRAEVLFSRADIQEKAQKGAGSGVTGASKVSLYAPQEDLTFTAKWKPFPYWLDSWNNSPRREIAAYEIQKLFLDPDDYVVPTAAARCLPLEEYRQFVPGADPTFEDSQCVLGVLALWLQNVTIDEQLLSLDRFERDPNYAYHLANLNVLTFLIGHRDGRLGNFMVSKNESDRHAFAIDNGISFDAFPWNFFVPNTNKLFVPALSRKAVERLRQIRPDQLDRLGVLTELRLEADGVYRPVEPGPNLDPKSGVRTAPGVIQLGLKQNEIDDVRERIREILTRVDSGQLPVF